MAAVSPNRCPWVIVRVRVNGSVRVMNRIRVEVCVKIDNLISTDCTAPCL